MKYVVCLVLLLPCVFAVPWVEMTQSRHMTDLDQGKPMLEVFATFKTAHGKTYESEFEETMRRNIFELNVQQMKEHNEKFARGEKSYYLGVNQFSDLTHQEFLKLYTGHLHKRNPNRNASMYLEPAHLNCPETVDWNKEGYVTPVKNQGQCGSCWSFSATGSLEGQYYRQNHKLVSLSEQQLVDCSQSFGNQGCNGGLMDQAFDYIKSVGGLETEDDYPYVAEVEDRCKFKKAKAVAEDKGYKDIESGSESMLKKAVCSEGPISVAIDASHPSFQSYAGGVYDEPECSSEKLDHGVLVIGYGIEPQDYWLVKNSWGTEWGLDGFVKMSRNNENQCGIASQASYPLV